MGFDMYLTTTFSTSSVGLEICFLRPSQVQSVNSLRGCKYQSHLVSREIDLDSLIHCKEKKKRVHLPMFLEREQEKFGYTKQIFNFNERSDLINKAISWEFFTIDRANEEDRSSSRICEITRHQSSLFKGIFNH